MRGLVMIVDDHAFMREMLRAEFEGEGLEVCEAINGAEAIQRARQVIPSVIILDLSMPVMNGLQAARELKALMPDVPLVMFTNHLKEAVEKEARAAGISAVVSKFDSDAPALLLAKAKALLGLDGAKVRRAS